MISSRRPPTSSTWMARGARTSSSTWKKRPRSPLGGTPHARVGGGNRGPPRDGPGGLGQGDPGVRASGPEVRLRRCVLSCHWAGVPRCPGPSFCPYSPGCVEGKFSEVDFRFTEFSEVRLKTNSQKYWAPHRHKKDRSPYTTGPRPRKGRLALREATPM